MQLSIVIPCHNESNRISKTIERINAFFQDQNQGQKFDLSDFEIICIENGSTDSTYAVLLDLMKTSGVAIRIFRTEKGKGMAIREGVRQAKYDPILIMDADNATDISYVKDLLVKMYDSHSSQTAVDIVNSSRRMPGSVVMHKQSILRRIGGNLFHIITRRIFDLTVTDSQNGFKLFKAEIAKRLYEKVKTTGWVSEIELFVLAKKYRYKVVEVPVVWKDISGSTLNIKDAPRILKDLAKLWLRI